MKELEIVLKYWQLAPQKGWSRWPLIITGICFLTTVWLVVSAFSSN